MRSYDLAQLEASSTLSRRTISDYVSRGLLSGPSHRGRGARYSQRDLDALQVIPLLRTVLKSEFPNLNAVREFLSDLSPADLRHLARLNNERAFEVEARRIRIHSRLKTFLPAVPPEQLTEALGRLTPEQICGIDRGRYQVGSWLDIERLSRDSNGGVADAESEAQWERFGTPTVQVRIEKRALGRTGADPRISATIHAFAKQIEDLLKAAG